MPTDVELVRRSLPCSVELPAGTGKTDLIARLVKATTDDGVSALVLTHTHAGVDVLRRRMKHYGVNPRQVRIRTLDGWCVELVRSFPVASGESIPEEPDWTRSKYYHRAGSRAIATEAVRRMLAATYGLLVVDEYQDCQLWQHELVVAISHTVPTVVLGDRMQGLFYFGDSYPVEWETDVVGAFPPVELNVYAWRWAQSNSALGAWLLTAREALLAGQSLDLSTTPVQVYPENQRDAVLRGRPRYPETTVAIARSKRAAPDLAQRLNGDYTMIEEIAGDHLRQFARVVDGGDPASIAAETVDYAVACATGVATAFPAAARANLRHGRALPTATADPARLAAAHAVNAILADPTPYKVRAALEALSDVANFILYRQESWRGVLDALRLAETTDGLSVLDAVVRGRQRISLEGRRPEARIVGRALLVKGLEFDHAVVLEPRTLNAHELYVSLTRGSRSVALISNQTVFRPARPRRSGARP